MSPWRTWLVVSEVCKVMLDSPFSGWRARATRARKRAAKAGSGSIGVGAVRSASNGSGTASVLLFRVGAAERHPGAHEQRFGGVDGAVENIGNVGDGQVVQVPQREYASVLQRELLKRLPRAEAIQMHIPRVLRLGLLTANRLEAAFLTAEVSPVIDQLVARDAQQPGRRQAVWASVALQCVQRGQYRLGRELFGEHGGAAAGEQVPIHVGQRGVVQREKSLRAVLRCRRVTAHN